MSQVIALIPARIGSKGVIGKNFRELGDRPLWQYAADCAHRCLRDDQQPGAVVLSTDAEWVDVPWRMERRTEVGPFQLHRGSIQPVYLRRPPELAQDDTPMLAVVQHALTVIFGEPDDIIVLLQPTQPFRTPAHVTEAIRLLRETKADSVVSVTPLPLTHSAQFQLGIEGTGHPVLKTLEEDYTDLMDLPKRRQDVSQTYIRDGTVYAFWRKTVTTWQSIYGYHAVPLIIAPEDTCKLDTEADWDDVTRRWQERHAATARS